MSRIGKQPIVIPNGVAVTIDKGVVTVKGPKGELTRAVHRDIAVEVVGSRVQCTVARNSKQAPALWGTTRALIAQMIAGVMDGFQKKLEMHGVGYKAIKKGNNLELYVGYSHPVLIEAPSGITFTVDNESIIIDGYDAQKVGQVAANIRKIRPPEPYKGKGIRYADEVVRRKVGKVVGSTEGAV